MAKRILALLTALTLSTQADFADATEQVVRFKAGASSATLSGSVSGYDGMDYRLGAKAGQSISVRFEPSNPSCYFNVLPPNSNDVAIFVGSSSGNEFTGNLTQAGNYVIRVYLMRNAARRNEKCRYTLAVETSPKAARKAPSASVDALVPGTIFNATAEVPCSRAAGQPTTSCKAGVVRRGNGSADVTVFWPDGGSRVLFFKDGQFAGADISGADGDTPSSTTENGLYLIRVGAQRFEIPDVLVLGG
ncbi:hypothetical protein ACQKGL_18690 [Ensifer adhaerens]|uniref:hypothetical protein n=1 Tax=Ensifer adhaerens TaxID=106592 RepID=UPI003D04DD57